MRICLFSNAFLPSLGGYQQVSATLAQAFQQAGHPTTVVTATPAPADFDEQFAFRVLRRTADNAIPWRDLLRDVDVVLSMGASLRHLFAWRRAGVPVVYIHGTYLVRPARDAESFRERVRLEVGWAVRRTLLKLADSHVYYSKAMRDEIHAEPGKVIYNPVDPKFRPMPEVAAAADFGFFGRLIRDKGVGTLLDALAICKRVGHCYTVHVYGEGGYDAEARRQAETLDIAGQVEWKGFRRGEEVVRAMNSVDVVVIPSLWSEPLGMVAVEAMACGKTVIGSSGGGLGEVIGTHGLTFPNGDASALADRMMRLKQDPALKAELERSASEYARQFTAPRVIEEYLDHLREVLRRRAT
jgi:glycosyltransferase involved in cell wall biosynthesis